MNRIFLLTKSISSIAVEHTCCVHSFEWVSLQDGTLLVAVSPSKVHAKAHLADRDCTILNMGDLVGDSLALSIPKEWGILPTDYVGHMMDVALKATGNSVFDSSI